LYLNLETGQVLKSLRGKGKGEVSWVAFAADGRHAFSASQDGMAQLWDLTEGKEVRRFRTRGKWARSGAELPDGRRLLTADDSGLLQLWEVATGQELQRIDIGPGWICSLALTADGRHALVGKGEVSVWNLETQQNVRQFQGHEGEVRQIVLSPNNRWLLTASFDGAVRLWDYQAGEILRVLGSHGEFAFSAVFSPNGELVASGGGGRLDESGKFHAGKDHDIRIWDITSLPTEMAATPGLGAKGQLVLLLSLLLVSTLVLGIWLHARQRGIPKNQGPSGKATPTPARQ
jgi:WD40 repeat protein